MISSRLCTATRGATALLGALLATPPLGAQNPPPASTTNAVQQWLASNAHPLRTVEVDGPLDDLRPLARVVGTARLVTFGEQTHGAHEPLAFRNRLFRYLVEQLDFTAIALETGLPRGASAQ